MPELPEVETIRRGLEPQLVGERVAEVEIGDRKVFQFDAGRLFEELPGRTFLSASRRGKFLIFELTGGWLVVHLGMTGQLTIRRPDRNDGRFHRHPATGLQRSAQHAPDRHTHLIVYFESGKALQYRDIRKFGKIHWRGLEGVQDLLARLGPEPFGEAYTEETFVAALKGRKLRVKSLLLNQQFVAGIGNIYADEALFESGIHPLRTVRSLRRYEKLALFEAIPKVLEKGIEYGGTTLRDYLDSDGQEGSNQDELNVYGRTDRSCRRCGETISKIVVSQRGTHFCPKCQPRRGRKRATGG